MAILLESHKILKSILILRNMQMVVLLPVGGATDNNQNIVMNVNFDTEKNRLHKIFHTFGFEHPKMKGGSSGIMCYPPRSPNAKDAQLFGSDLLNDVLPFIKKEK